MNLIQLEPVMDLPNRCALHFDLHPQKIRPRLLFFGDFKIFPSSNMQHLLAYRWQLIGKQNFESH